MDFARYLGIASGADDPLEMLLFLVVLAMIVLSAFHFTTK
jgi:hypothetical protein